MPPKQKVYFVTSRQLASVPLPRLQGHLRNSDVCKPPGRQQDSQLARSFATGQEIYWDLVCARP